MSLGNCDVIGGGVASKRPSSSSHWFRHNQRTSSSTPSELSLSGSLLTPPKVITVAVVGLNDGERQKSGLGAGKSCLCNRFVRPFADAYRTDHISTVSTVDFNGRVINGDHWLFWGDRTILLPVFGSSDPISHSGNASQYVNLTVRVIEQTEFIDDVTFQVLKNVSSFSDHIDSYAKRCATSKLQSIEKLMYLCKDQLGFESDYEQKQLPDNKIAVDGFLCVFDTAACSNKPSGSSCTTFTHQLQILQEILQNVCKTKKPVIIATAKNDEEPLSPNCGPRQQQQNKFNGGDYDYKRLLEKFLLSKKEFKHLAQNVVETSSHWNVNVESAFLLLVHLIDKTCFHQKPKVRPFREALEQQQDLVREVTENFMNLLSREVRDTKSTWERVKSRLVNEPCYENFIDILGSGQAASCFNKFLKELLENKHKRRLEKQIERLPRVLANLSFNLDDVKQKSWTDVVKILKSCPNFCQLFKSASALPSSSSFRQQDGFKDSRLPVDLLFTAQAEQAFANLVYRLQAEYLSRKLTEDFWNVLSNCGQVTPGKPLEDVKIFLIGKPCYDSMSESDARMIYDQYQGQIIRKARRDFMELLLEQVGEFVRRISTNRQQMSHFSDVRPNNEKATTPTNNLGFSAADKRLLSATTDTSSFPRSPSGSSSLLLTCKDLEELNEKLSDDFRYRHLNKLRQIRDNMIWQFANFLYTNQQCPAELSCVDFLVEDLLDNYLGVLASHSTLNNAVDSVTNATDCLLDDKACDINLLIVDLDGMGENFVSETQVFLTEKEFIVHDVMLRFNYSCVSRDYLFNSDLFDQSNENTILPDGIVCVFSCRSSLDLVDQWLSKNSHILSTNVNILSSPTVVLVLACDPSNLDDLPYLQQKATKMVRTFSSSPLPVVCLPPPLELVKFFGITPSSSHVTAERRAKASNSYFTDGQIERILDSLSREKYRKLNVNRSSNGSTLSSVKKPRQFHLNLILYLMCGDDFAPETVLKPFLNAFNSSKMDRDSKSFLFDVFCPNVSQKLTCRLNVSSYHDSLSKLVTQQDSSHEGAATISFDGYLFVYAAKRSASFLSMSCLIDLLLNKQIDLNCRTMVTAVGEVTEMFVNQSLSSLVMKGNDTADKLNARFSITSKTTDLPISQFTQFLEDCWFKKYALHVPRPAAYRPTERSTIEETIQKLNANLGRCDLNRSSITVRDCSPPESECHYMTVKDALRSSTDAADIQNEAQYATIESLWMNENRHGTKRVVQMYDSDMDFIPLFVQKCVEFIESEGLDTEGLYRVPGNQNQAQTLEDVFKQNPYVSFASLKFPVCVVTTALKNYFSALKQPLVPSYLHNLIIEEMTCDSSCNERKDKIRRILARVPRENRAILKYLMLHLRKIAENCSQTSMDLKNLAKCWWPTILRPEFDSFEIMALATHKFEQFVQDLLENPDFM